jgi:hypothetical protein
MPNFIATRAKVLNRGRAPVAFLEELVAWGRTAAEDIFLPNSTFDIYSSLVNDLGPWQGLAHRRAVMLEALRVLAGFESSWDWNAGVDTNNPTSNTPCTEEAGIFQCSGNSMAFAPSLRALLEATGNAASCPAFIQVTKANHLFAIEYCARLLRFTTKHHGPIKRREINPWVQREAVQEFQELLA